MTTTPSSAVTGDARNGTFALARWEWLDRRDHVRNRIRQEMISRQLDRHLPATPQMILDVGAGQGTQSIRLARAGHHVLAVEPDGEMRAAFTAALATEPSAVRDRVTLTDGALGLLEAVVHSRRFGAVLLLGCLPVGGGDGRAAGVRPHAQVPQVAAYAQAQGFTLVREERRDHLERLRPRAELACLWPAGPGSCSSNRDDVRSKRTEAVRNCRAAASDGPGRLVVSPYCGTRCGLLATDTFILC